MTGMAITRLADSRNKAIFKGGEQTCQTAALRERSSQSEQRITVSSAELCPREEEGDPESLI